MEGQSAKGGAKGGGGGSCGGGGVAYNTVAVMSPAPATGDNPFDLENTIFKI